MTHNPAQSTTTHHTHAARKQQKLREREEALRRIEKKRHDRALAVAARQKKRETASQATILTLPVTAIVPPVPQARLHLRHRLSFVSFIIIVLGTSLFVSWYLWERAADRYTSIAGFAVHSEDMSSPVELLGGVANLSGSGAADEEVLYQFIQSQHLVEKIDKSLNLRKIWSPPATNSDPVFGYHAPGTIEDLTKYWGRMVDVYSDSSTGLIEVKVQAFAPEDARAIVQEIYAESAKLIHELSAIAREDATQHAEENLARAAQRLKKTRLTLAEFRIRNQLVSPDTPLQIQTGLLASLEAEMTETLISIDMLQQTSTPTDPRLKQAQRRRDIIAARISQEHQKLNAEQGAMHSIGFADLFGQFESLKVDLEFAEQSYTASQAAFDTAVAEGRKRSKYLAAHIPPTLAETSIYPNRPFLLGVTFASSFALWALIMLVWHSLRDRH